MLVPFTHLHFNMKALNLEQYRIILASKSPRRQELLKGLGLNFEIDVPDVEEFIPDGMANEIVPMYLAGLKSAPFFDKMSSDRLVISSDTVVIVDNKILGKPKDKEDAKCMLKMLSGKKHQVISGVSIATARKRKLFSVTTHVYFKQLTNNEIEYYIETCKPFDKAGAYGIQEWIGFIGIEKIEGSYFNVVGLPLQRLYQELKHFM